MSVAITSQSTISRRRQLIVEFSVNHTYSAKQAVGSAHAFNSPEMLAQFQAYAEDMENGVKTTSWDWVTQDTERSVSFEMTEETVDGVTQLYCNVTFPIVATARLTTDAETDLDPESTEAQAIFQARAEAAVVEWFSVRPLTAL